MCRSVHYNDFMSAFDCIINCKTKDIKTGSQHFSVESELVTVRNEAPVDNGLYLLSIQVEQTDADMSGCR